MSPADLGELTVEQFAKWTKGIRQADIKVAD